MKIRKKDYMTIIKSVSEYKKLKTRLSRKITKKSNLYRIARDIPDELLVILSAHSKTHLNNIKDYYKNIKPVKIDITGNDLKSLSFRPSKNYRIALSKLMEMKIDGSITTRQEQINEAKKILSRLKRQQDTPG